MANKKASDEEARRVQLEGVGPLESESVDELVVAVTAWAERADVRHAFEEFCAKRCHEAEWPDAEDEEQSLRSHEIFEDFERLFEEKLGELLREEGLSDEQFFKWASAAREDAGHEADMLLQIALGALDYRAFVRLMRAEMGRVRSADEAAEDMGL